MKLNLDSGTSFFGKSFSETNTGVSAAPKYLAEGAAARMTLPGFSALTLLFRMILSMVLTDSKIQVLLISRVSVYLLNTKPNLDSILISVLRLK